MIQKLHFFCKWRDLQSEKFDAFFGKLQLYAVSFWYIGFQDFWPARPAHTTNKTRLNICDFRRFETQIISITPHIRIAPTKPKTLLNKRFKKAKVKFLIKHDRKKLKRRINYIFVEKANISDKPNELKQWHGVSEGAGEAV